MEVREYGAYSISTPLVVILAIAGVLTGSTAFLVAATIPLVFLLLTSISSVPDQENISVKRSIGEEAPSPGQEVEVTVEVKNNGRRTLTDLRLIDEVPEGLKVSEGSPRSSVAVTPGSAAEFSYSVVARRGSYVFGDIKAEFRSRGTKAGFTALEPEGDDLIECKTGLEETVLRDRTEGKVGDIVTSQGGSGIEFHSLRDYKSSDPLARVEWRHLAKTGELATKNFKEERSGKIVLMLDARTVSNRKAEKGHPTGVDLSAYAAERTFKALLKSRHKPGLGVLGVDPEDLGTGTESPKMPYVQPGRGRKTRRKIEQILEEVRNTEKGGEDKLESKLYEVLPPNSQIIFFSPLLDDRLEETLKILDSHGFPSIVVSPDITYSDDPASRMHSITRDLRLKQIRKVAPVVDWDISQPMSIQVSKALRRIYGNDLG
jgi:uncharacterized repeat protein (TIGR01451 family)